jgi:hypothetical protein
MSYIGSSPTTAAFVTDSFSGNASTTAFTMSVAPANTSSALVAISGVLQDPTTYAVNGTTLTFSSAPPLGTGNISIRYLGIPASGVTTTAYRTVTEFTATQNQTTFSTPSYTVGYINVYRNGIRLASGDYTASSGTSVILNNSCSLNDLVTVESLSVSSVSNAIPQTGGIINSPSGATPLQVQSNNILGLYQDASANVGIGTASPAAKLDVRGSSTFLINATNPTAWASVDSGLTTQSMYMQVNTTSSDTRLGSYTSHPLLLLTGNTERMRIDSSGFVGIGTNSPSSYGKLSVTGTTSMGVDQTSFISVLGGGGTARIEGNGSDTNINVALSTKGTGGHYFWRNGYGGALTALFEGNGNIQIGGSSVGTTKFNVSGNALITDTLQIFNNPSSSAQGILFRNTYNTGPSIFSTGAATTNSFISWVGGSGAQGAINGNGAGISYTSASDYRLKENITPMTGALAKVATLKPVTYTWKSTGSDGDGFIAHELAEVCPWAVHGEKDGVDKDGNPEYQSVDTSFLVGTLTAAIQELKADLDATKAELAALKTKVGN